MTNTKHNHGKVHTNLKIEKKAKSTAEITGSIPWDDISHWRMHVLQDMKENVELPGFRKGKVPEDMIIKKFGEMSILQEAAEMAIENAYPHIMEEAKLDTVGRPNVSFTKLAPNNELEFKIETALMPEVKLPEYKAIAKKINSKKEKIEVTDKEVDESLEFARKQIAGIKPDDKETKLPELTDEEVKKLGNFTSVTDLKDKVKEGIQKEKELKAEDKKRAEIADKIVAESEIDIPEILIAGELHKIESTFRDDISKMGMSTEDYLKHVNKTIEDLRKDWKPTAEKKARLQLCINKIAEIEKIAPTEEEMKKEAEAIMKYYKETDETRVRIYVEMILTNEKVFEFLAKQ